MKSRLSGWLFCIGTIALAYSLSARISQGAQTNVYEWMTRPQLTSDQQRMLQQQKASEIGREDSPLHSQRQAELAVLLKKLGPRSVRDAKPNELFGFAISTNVCEIHNPTDEGLVLTVSIMGDVEQLGTRMASMGRQAYFPPGSTIVVSNLYWTSPATAKKTNK